MRAPLAVLAGAAVAGLAAAVFGEYAFDGWAVLGGGLLVGLFVGEAVLSVAGEGSRSMAACSALLATASMTGAAWISTGHRLGTLGWKGWTAIALGGVAGAFRARSPAAARRSPAGPAAAE